MATVGNTERALAGIALLTFPKRVLDTPQRKVTSAVHIKSCCWTTVISWEDNNWVVVQTAGFKCINNLIRNYQILQGIVDTKAECSNLKSRISPIMDNRRTELRKLADVIGSNIVEKCDVTPARTIQLYTCFALQIFSHIFRLVCATFSPSFRHKFPLWWNHPTPSWRPTNRWWEIRPRDISFPSSLTTIVISQSSFSGIVFHSLIALVNYQSPVVQKVNNVIHWIFCQTSG